MGRFFMASVMALGLLVPTSVVQAEDSPSETVETFGPVAVGAEMPTFAGYDGSNRFVRSKQLVADSQTGLIISFFATWCAPCRAGMPVIDEQVKGREGWSVVYIDYGEEPAKVQPFITSLGVDGTVVYDPNGMIAKRFGVSKTLPKTFVMAPDGKVTTIFVTEGHDFKEKLSAAMDTLEPNETAEGE